jgi:hypothetical protein
MAGGRRMHCERQITDREARRTGARVTTRLHLRGGLFPLCRSSLRGAEELGVSSRQPWPPAKADPHAAFRHRSSGFGTPPRRFSLMMLQTRTNNLCVWAETGEGLSFAKSAPSKS